MSVISVFWEWVVSFFTLQHIADCSVYATRKRNDCDNRLKAHAVTKKTRGGDWIWGDEMFVQISVLCM